MDWQIIFIIGLLLGVILISFLKIKSKKLGRIDGKKAIQFATPRKSELILLFLYGIFFMWFDLLQNKAIDLGIDYKVNWFGDVMTSALDLSIIMLIIFHIILVSLFLISLKSKGTHRIYDSIMGVIALFGIAILLGGFVNSLYSDTIRFLFIDMSSTEFYHVGVAIEFVYGLYLAFTS